MKEARFAAGPFSRGRGTSFAGGRD